MSMKDTIVVDGVTYTKQAEAGEYTALMIESGWTLVGIATNGDDCVSLCEAYVVRRYGNGSGVSGIVSKDEAVFDSFDVPNVDIPLGKILFSFVLPKGWSPK